MRVPRKNWLEWTTFAVSTLLILAVVGYLGWQATRERTPPNLEVIVGETQERPGRYLIPVTVRNRGNQTAESAEVTVTLVLGGPDMPDEESSFTVSYIPAHSERRGWTTFLTDPREAKRIEARVQGYHQP